MCGFVGGIFKTPVRPDAIQAIGRALATLEHRGPDGRDVLHVEDANAVLGFHRLAIIDLERGDQPMSTASRQHIVFNGEIYNYRELRDSMERAGERFETTSDTEVLLRSLASDVPAALERIRGMFAFAFIDIPNHRLVLARDRLGIKPLYYVEHPSGFFFASEPKALTALPWVEARFAEDQLANYFVFRSVPSPHTLFRNLRKLPAGHLLTYDFEAHSTDLRPYWRLPFQENGALERHPQGRALERFEQTFLQSVEHRLVADVPVGAFLSGGLDSSLVVAAMKRLGLREPKTFSATFPGSPDDESSFARRVSGAYGTEHHEFPTTSDAFLELLPTWVQLNDDLVADASSLPLLWLSHLARQEGCFVLLSGEGADELFAGYGSYHKFYLLHRLSKAMPSPKLRHRAARLLERVGVIDGQDVPRVAEYFVRGAAYMGTAAIAGPEELGRLVSSSDGAGCETFPRASGSSLGSLCEFDFVRRIPDDLLIRTDRATMGASVEARVPFLDHEVVALTLGLPSNSRAFPGLSKTLLRRLALKWKVPRQTIAHRKIGFQLPIGEWFRGPLRPLWQRILSDGAVPRINYDRVAGLVEAHENRGGRYEEMLWRIMSLELWYRRHLIGDPIASLPGLDG